MIEGFIFGTLQGIAEWLPVSSEGVIFLVQTNFFSNLTIEQTIRFALFLHLGTALAALLYFWKDFWNLLKTFFNYKNETGENKLVLNFLIISTLISGTLGILLLKTLINIEGAVELSGKTLTFLIGILLLFTAYLQLKKKSETSRNLNDLKPSDGIWLGIAQGIAVLPGLSRSGMTVSVLLLRKFDDVYALKLSFLMSVPIVIAGNIILNIKDFSLSLENLIGFFFAFLFGILTIKFLLEFARKVNFGYFILIFGILMMISIFF